MGLFDRFKKDKKNEEEIKEKKNKGEIKGKTCEEYAMIAFDIFHSGKSPKEYGYADWADMMKEWISAHPNDPNAYYASAWIYANISIKSNTISEEALKLIHLYRKGERLEEKYDNYVGYPFGFKSDAYLILKNYNVI